MSIGSAITVEYFVDNIAQLHKSSLEGWHSETVIVGIKKPFLTTLFTAVIFGGHYNWNWENYLFDFSIFHLKLERNTPLKRVYITGSW